MGILNEVPVYCWLLIAGGTVLLLVIKRSKFLFKFLLRALAGLCAVYFINMYLGESVGGFVGINLLSACVVGILGIPGFVLLYLAGAFL